MSTPRGPMDVQVFRVNDGGGASLCDVVHLETWYKFPPNDAIRVWVREKHPNPGVYMMVAPGSEFGPIPCSQTFSISYPEFMVVTKAQSRAPLDKRVEWWYEGDDRGVRGLSRDGQL